MKQPRRIGASVIIATRNRSAPLNETLESVCLATCQSENVEIVVVDDGSEPPIDLANRYDVRLARQGALGRSAARNAGAHVAGGELLVFLDDDMSVAQGFLEAHAQAQMEWSGVLATGAVRLPDEAQLRPFGRFRQRLEDAGVPPKRGLSRQPNCCAAANMSILRSRFVELGGFDPGLSSGEDQDLALRHASAGGAIAFIPEACAIHRDQALHIRAYCRRIEAGAEHDVAFVRKRPEWPENQHRQRINGHLAFGREPVGISLEKLSKTVLGYGPFETALFSMAELLERAAPNSSALDRLYRILLGIHIRRGYLRGLRAHPGG